MLAKLWRHKKKRELSAESRRVCTSVNLYLILPTKIMLYNVLSIHSHDTQPWLPGLWRDGNSLSGSGQSSHKPKLPVGLLIHYNRTCQLKFEDTNRICTELCLLFIYLLYNVLSIHSYNCQAYEEMEVICLVVGPACLPHPQRFQLAKLSLETK